MNDWYTILTFTYPQEAYLPKAKLKDEGIMVMIKNELPEQVIKLYGESKGVPVSIASYTRDKISTDKN